MSNVIKRELWQTFLGIPAGGSSQEFAYEVIGEDNDTLTEELNANVSKTKNVLGKNSTAVDSYSPTMSVSPYKADKGTKTFVFLKGIADGLKTHADCQTHVIDVDLFAEASQSEYPAIKKGVIVEVKSIGGNTDALQIPYELHYTNENVPGKFNPTTKKFTPTLA